MSYSQVFSGVDTDGVTEYSVNPFTPGSEEVYVLGARLVRTLGYSTSSSSIIGADKHDTIVINTDTYPASLFTESTVVEILTDFGEVNPYEEILSQLEDIKTAVMGSWTWDKMTGLLTMYDSSGVERFKFNVEDNSNSASRERRQDLE